ncbi:radical SAM/SPASM domain-containing protein [Nonomuraea sp. NPDC059023]|uniref:radical SAM/SPASM domain-containing protein n=1 Tax=unclassified Nonomuraea TaxID=2593643 RepID=UPI0036793A87
MSTAPPALDFFWAEITGKCQLACTHCYAGSGPDGTHGAMTATEWAAAITQARALGARMVQFIGGEPTLHPDLPTLIAHALGDGLQVEVYTNLVHVTPSLWDVFAQPKVMLATSYYTDDPDQHQQITQRRTHHRTHTNIGRAIALGIPIRAGIIDIHDGQHVEQAKQQLARLGVTDISVDRMRLLGRPARQSCDVSQLCGRCGDGIAAILPDGTVTPCPLSRWLSAGNIRETGLTSLVGAAYQLSHEQILPAVTAAGAWPCEPNCNPGCAPGMQKPDNCHPKGSCNPTKPPDPQCTPTFKCAPTKKK